MNTQERETFWNMLCSLSGNDVAAEANRLRQTIRYPRYLYRYRSVSINSLEALRTNHLFFSSSNYYDDPFDTFLNINVESIRNSIVSAVQNPEYTEKIINQAKSLLKGVFSEDILAQWTSAGVDKAIADGQVYNLINYVLSLRDDIKKDTWSVCFSENGFNEALWIKYADQHKGFVQIYDLENDSNYLCGKQEKCANCGVKQYGAMIYPVYYSDSPYDATKFAKWVLLHKIAETTGLQIPQAMYAAMGNCLWERERTTLIKKECHKYDEEWRMILCGSMKPPFWSEWIPSGIILGLRMEPSEENLVVSMAKEAGIKMLAKSFINAKNKLDAYLLN